MRSLRVAVWVSACATPFLFAYGPLFPWSPVKPGYQRLALERADVYYPDGSLLPPAYRQLDSLIGEAERFHRLPMPRRVAVVAVRDWNDFHRFMPNYPGTAVGAVTLATGTVIYVTPKIAERGLDLREFLRHELSHAAMHQNTPIARAFAMQKVSWVYEGVPVWFGRQRAYLTQEEFRERARTIDFLPAFTAPGGDMRFNYVVWRDFIDFLDQSAGRETFWRFYGEFRQHPGRIDVDFASAYGHSIEQMIHAFQAAVCTGTYVPRDPD